MNKPDDDPYADPDKAEAYAANIESIVLGHRDRDRADRARATAERDKSPTIIGQAGFGENVVAAIQ